MMGERIGEGRTAEVFAWGDDAILKLWRADFPADDAHYEAEIMRAVLAAGVRAPMLKEVIIHQGRVGLVIQRASGPTMASTVFSNPAQGVQLAHQLADLHLMIHTHNASGLPRLKDRLRAGIEQTVLTPPEKDHLLRDLDTLPDGDTVCHMDLHPYNVILAPDGPVVIDWIGAAAGPAAADVARSVVLMRMFSVYAETDQVIAMVEQFIEAYLAHYLGQSSVTRSQVDRWIPLIAAARLSEGIEEENEGLLGIVRQALD
ncbi:MAG: phosphotransferase family protein [Chloroflexota bacterium]